MKIITTPLFIFIISSSDDMNGGAKSGIPASSAKQVIEQVEKRKNPIDNPAYMSHTIDLPLPRRFPIRPIPATDNDLPW
jgi:hypothetical protein